MKDIRRATRKQYSSEEKIRIVLDGLRGEHSIAELCRREGIAESLNYNLSKEFLEAGKRRLAGDTVTQYKGSRLSSFACLLHADARGLKQALHHQPLRIRRIAFISQALASIMSTSDFSPGHCALPRIFANPKEPQTAEITQLFFSLALTMAGARIDSREF